MSPRESTAEDHVVEHFGTLQEDCDLGIRAAIRHDGASTVGAPRASPGCLVAAAVRPAGARVAVNHERRIIIRLHVGGGHGVAWEPRQVVRLAVTCASPLGPREQRLEILAGSVATDIKAGVGVAIVGDEAVGLVPRRWEEVE